MKLLAFSDPFLPTALVNENLIARCIREEPKAQYELYRELYSLMMSICTRYERNKQDAVARMNDGFLKILTHLPKRKDHVPFELWVRRIMINTVIDAHRRSKVRNSTEVLSDSVEDFESEEVNAYLRDMEAEEFERMMLALPETSAHVFNLYAIDGFTHGEIAETLGISEGTSRWHVANARKMLQEAILQEAKKILSYTR